MLFLLMACAPMYRPGLHSAPLFVEEGDLSAYGGGSLGGVQGGAAYAPLEHLGVRANAQTAGPGYARLSAGVGGWMAGPFDPELAKDTGIRLGLWADAAAGTSQSSLTINVNGVPTTTSYEGTFWEASGQGLVAFASPKVSSGLSVRAAWFQVHHVPGSDGFDDNGGIGHFVYVEPMLFARAGAEQLKLEVQLGGVLPLSFPEPVGAVGVPLPVNVGVGLVYER